MYSFKSRIRYSEVDKSKKLDLSSIINYFQDCSTFHSEDIGHSLKYLESINRAWILTSWQIIVNKLPSFGETITVGTWAYDYNVMYGYRNFIIKDEENSICAMANSVWVYMDTLNKRPIKLSPEDLQVFKLEDKLDFVYADRKIVIPEDLIESTKFQVVKSNIDTNNHVNNCQYVKMASELLPSDFVVNQMRAEYRISAVLGDFIVPKINITSNTCTIVLSNTFNKPYAIVEFTH